ncbi:MAG TPA: ATP cone domain-containing protein [Candidatus Saccharimonadales bacterium]|nr:ATP cone domain-containing protein [Candidatus Saccharimonadales bacterium]
MVKRANGQSQPFDPEKLYRSVYAACLSVQTPSGEAQLTARRVFHDMQPWLESKEEITTADVRRLAAHHLSTYNPHAAHLFASQPHLLQHDPHFMTDTPQRSTFPNYSHPTWLDIGKKGHWDS